MSSDRATLLKLIQDSANAVAPPIPPPTLPPWTAGPAIDVTGGKVCAFTSPTTGLRALLIETDESLCSLHVVIATEADTNAWSHKDDGLPHTLEHAIFMGSELYPYKGILDKVANRCCADGTNAWTATDHTCYTLTTAGAEGCLSMLPIYADHILYPTLTDECFLTEVHHVTSGGEDKGVVYCEMQGRENSASSLIDRAVLDLLYPSGGYSAETGGKMSNLRTLTNAQVRQYHAENYRADNIAFIVSGMVDEAAMLRALAEVDARVAAKPQPPPRPRPWAHAVAPFDASVVGVLPAAEVASTSADRPPPKTIAFPSEDESCGTVSMAWRGPTYAEQRTWLALRLLWKYLTDSAAAPLQKAFVECDEPLCGEVAPAHEIFTEGYHQVWFEGVEMEGIGRIVPAFFEAIAEARESFDLERMGLTLRRFRRVHLESVESNPSDMLVDPLIRYFLYEPEGAEPAGLRSHLDPLPELAPIGRMSIADWQGLIDRYILHTPCCAVVGTPSAELAKSIEADTEALTQANAARLGPAGLAALGTQLEAAVVFNERPIDESILTAVPIPDYSAVKGPAVFTMRGGGDTALAPSPGTGAGVPEAAIASVSAMLRASDAATKDASPYHRTRGLWVEWSHVESAFVTAAVAFDTSAVPPSLRLYLPLLLELWWKLPATLEDGATLSKDDFVGQLEDQTVDYSANFGQIRGRVSQLASASVKVELDGSAGAAAGSHGASGLGTALTWLRRSLYLTTTSAAHVRMAAKNMASRLPAAFREGSSMVSNLMDCVQYDGALANVVASCPMQQQPFVGRLLARLGSEAGAAHVLAQLAALRTLLLRPDRMQVLVACNLTNVKAPYEQLVAALAPPPPSYAAIAAPSAGATAMLGAIRKGVSGQTTLAPLAAIESAYVLLITTGLGPKDADYAPLRVMMEHLSALEGDFWVKLRGAGLTYGSSLSNDTERRALSFSLYRCADALSAYKAAKQIIVDYATGALSISDVQLAGAKSSLAYNIISRTSTKSSVVNSAWSSAYLGVEANYDRWLLAQVDATDVSAALHTLRKYLVPLFDASANMAVTCPPSKVEALTTGLEAAHGAAVRVVPEDQLNATFGPEDGDAAPPQTRGGTKPSAGAFAFAKQFGKCECPRCGPAPEAGGG